jgi:hypothetical protein
VVNVTFTNLSGTRQRALRRLQMQREQQENGIDTAKDK